MGTDVDELRGELQPQIQKAIELVTRVAVLQESAEKTRNEDRLEFKEVMKSVAEMSKQIGNIDDIKKELAEHYKEIGVHRHDIVDIKAAATKHSELLEKYMEKQATALIVQTELRKDVQDMKDWRGRLRDNDLKKAGVVEYKHRTWKFILSVAGVAGTFGGTIMWLFQHFFGGDGANTGP